VVPEMLRQMLRQQDAAATSAGTAKKLDHYGAASTFYDDNICETRFMVLCTSCLEFTTENCSQ